MEDEIIKHSQKIREELKNKKHSVLDRIKEIVIEVVIIIFAVTISIYLHNWSEHKHQQKEAKEFLSDLKNDLAIDIQNMADSKKSLEKGLKSLEQLSKPKEKSRKDTSDKNSFDLINRVAHKGDYESFKTSGKIGYIENKEIKKMMITYYEENMPITVQLEELFNKKIIEIFEMPESGDRGLLNKKLHLDERIATGLINLYNENMKISKNIIIDIDNQKQE